MKRVVITGMDMITSLGKDMHSSFSNIVIIFFDFKVKW